MQNRTKTGFMSSVDDVMMLAFHAVAQRTTAGFMKSVMHFDDDANC